MLEDDWTELNDKGVGSVDVSGAYELEPAIPLEFEP
jgi:hypothetical protein